MTGDELIILLGENALSKTANRIRWIAHHSPSTMWYLAELYHQRKETELVTVVHQVTNGVIKEFSEHS